MKSVYVVQHSYELDDCEETKFIGVFSTLKKAEEIVEKYKIIAGFKDYQDDFFIDEYTLDALQWKDGFVRV